MSSVAQATPSARPAIRVLATAQLATTGAFLVVVLLYLGRMAAADVGPTEMLTGAYDPKDMLSYWVYGVLGVLYVTGAFLGPPLAVVAVALVAREREALSRTIRVLLLTGAAGTLLMLVLRFTPPLLDMHQWWLD
ncbi:hypothetical protein [Micromonospora parathelypteridis]|uniref:Uncharacterized protein n=1 Tax=Micromonospora parathelypteridis TaxID=1839617 RepID=A0A840VNC4_9ACTN|nr:hypothetical protein [Micromonospora parathelypteridis]MBB5478573.1 hypothetical protein [Micromonospora parathelypteridis]GGO05614.1 hypothetical protein GCM10011576_08360 [Micromonospora parathelypteridis]